MFVENKLLTFDFNEQQIDNRLCCAVSFSDKYEYFALIDSVTHIPFRIGQCELGNSLGELCDFSIDDLKMSLNYREKYINDLTPQKLIRDLYGDFKNTCKKKYFNEYKCVLNDIKKLKDSRETVIYALTHVLSQPDSRFTVDDKHPLSFKYSGEFIFEDLISDRKMLYKEDIPINSWFIPKTITDLINYTLYCYITHNIHFRKCVFCERFFALTDGYKSEYCKRDIPYLGIGKTCRSHGKTLMYGKRIKDDPVRKAYTRSYRTHNARVRNGIMSKLEFDSWAKQAQEMRDKCIQGLISLQDLNTWLNQDKLRNTAN